MRVEIVCSKLAW